MTIDAEFFDWPVFGLAHAEKQALLQERLYALTDWHVSRCEPYARILRARAPAWRASRHLEQCPFLPVRLFKQYRLASIADIDVVKVLTSSGTSSQQVSRILLSQENARAQSRALVLILQQFLGKGRLPMLIVDHPANSADRQSLSARGAGIAGISLFGRDHTYALRPDMSLDLAAIDEFLGRHGAAPFLMFGFTFMVWKYFLQALERTGSNRQFAQATLIHGGGWKKLRDEAVSNQVFRTALQQVLGVSRVHDYYGMVEQVGSIFVECRQGRLHTPSFAEVLIRRPGDWAVLPQGALGLIQVMSLLPSSYPGHSLLTEDIGYWTGVDDCPCGRLGRTLTVAGRLPRAELRGCSDTFAAPLGGGTA